ncbi:MAG: class I SAM-dependent methyltransferase [Bacteroidetes bacterium]|nr:class I SAM-dependent methyltransferase [Bacteroidota bacterium]
MSLLNNYLQGTLRQIKKTLGIKPDIIPYMKFKEIAIMKDLFATRKPLSVLEYGCGYSSLFYPQFLPEQATWTSIEHDKEWFEGIQPLLPNKGKATIHFVAPDAKEWRRTGTLDEFKSYVEKPLSMGKFDFILVDGMAREACIETAKKLLNEKGILVVHDANRSWYHDHIRSFPNWILLEDFRRTSGGLAIASLDENPEKYLNISKHLAEWKTDASISNFFKFKFLLFKSAKKFRFSKSTKP